MLRKIFASLFVLFFVLISVPVVYFWGIFNVFIDENFYKDDFSNIIYELIIQELPKKMVVSEFPALDENDYRDVLSTIVKKEDVNYMVMSVIDQLKDLKPKENGEAQLRIPLDWLTSKNDLVSETLGTKLYDHLPRCEPGYIPKGDELDCIPTELSKIDFINEIKREFDREVFSEMADEFVLDFKVPDNIGGNVSEFFLSIFKNVLLVGFLVLILLLGLIAVTILRPPIRILKWEMKAVALSSIMICVGLLVLLAFPSIFETVYRNMNETVDVSSLELMKDLYEFFINAFAKNLLKYVIPIGFLAIGLWIFAFINDRKALKDDAS